MIWSGGDLLVRFRVIFIAVFSRLFILGFLLSVVWLPFVVSAAAFGRGWFVKGSAEEGVP
jgi:hypothetical protein